MLFFVSLVSLRSLYLSRHRHHMVVHLKHFVFISLICSSTIVFPDTAMSQPNFGQRVSNEAPSLLLAVLVEFINQLLDSAGFNQFLPTSTSVEIYPRIGAKTGTVLIEKLKNILLLSEETKTTIGFILQELSILKLRYKEIGVKVQSEYIKKLCQKLKLDPNNLSLQEEELVQQSYNLWMKTPEFMYVTKDKLKYWASCHVRGTILAGLLNQQLRTWSPSIESSPPTQAPKQQLRHQITPWYDTELGIAVTVEPWWGQARVAVGYNWHSNQLSASTEATSGNIPIISDIMPTQGKVALNYKNGRCSLTAKGIAVLLNTNLVKIESHAAIKGTSDQKTSLRYGLHFSAGM
jgi:hypothetical protein